MVDEHDEFIRDSVKQLYGMINSIANVLNSSIDRHGDNASTIEHMQKELSGTRDGLAKIVKILHEGNGERPLLTRVAILETTFIHQNLEVKQLNEHVEEIEQKMLDIKDLKITEDKSDRNTRTAGRVLIVTAVISGVFGTIAALVQMFTR